MKIHEYNEMMSYLTRRPMSMGGRVNLKSGTPFQITNEVLKKIDDLIKKTNLDLKTIGKQIGFGTDKTQLKIDAPVMKAYIEKYGKPKPGRLKPANLAKDPEYVQFVIDKVKELGSKKAAAKELGITRKTINNILKQKAPELMKPANIPGPETGAKAVKKRAEEAVKEAKKKAGIKTTKQADLIVNKILDKNKEYAAMSADDLAQDKNFLNRLRLRINTKTGDVDFTGYTEANPVRGKVFNDVELAQHAIDKAKKGELITPDHITPKAKRKQNVGYPINFQPATYMENSQFENARKFLIDNPDVDAGPIDNYLKLNVQTIRFDNKKFGYDGNIVFDSEKGTQTLVDKPGLEAGRLKDPMAGTKGFLGGPEMAKATGRSLLTALKVLGQPSIAAGFAIDEARKGNIKTAGASLLAPELVGSAAPKGTSLLSKAGRLAMNPFGRAARAFTPVGLATIGAGAAYDLYKEFERRQALTDEERLDEDLEAQEKYDEMMVGAADGGLITGRMGFAEGPKDPSRRKFIKIMGGLASLPIVGKYFKFAEKAAPVVQQLKNTTTTMPEWFPSFIDKVINRGVGKKIDADLMEYEVKELPGIKVTKSDDGRVFVEGKNDYYKSYEIDYTPPGYEVIDEKTGKAVKRPGDFMAQEEVPVNVDPDGNADFDAEVLEDLDQILGSDTRTMEEFATGKSVKGMKSGEFAVGRAEAQADAAKDFDDFYED